MKHLLFIFLCLISYCSLGQIDSKDQKKLNKIFKDDFSVLPSIGDYSPYFECQECIMDTSMVYLNRVNGARYNNQFVLHHDPISFDSKQEVLRFISNAYVTNADYQEFQDWTRDSIARNLIIRYLFDDEDAARFGSFESTAAEGFRRNSRRLISLNWEHRFYYEDQELVPILAIMYNKPSQRYYRQREFDYSNYKYQYTGEYTGFKGLKYDSVVQIFHYTPDVAWSSNAVKIKNEVPVFRIKFEMAKTSNHLRDERSVIAELDERLFNEFPVHGIDGFQANAFCNWKSKQIQAKLNDAELPYSAVVTLPIKDDVVNEPSVSVNFEIEGRDYTEQWNISNDDYLEFMQSVEDSVLREFLYMNLEEDFLAARFLDHPEYYFSEPDLEYVDIEFSDRDINRELFSLNYKRKIKRKDDAVQELLESDDYKLRMNSMFEYCQMDAKGYGLDGQFKEKIMYNGTSTPDTMWVPDNSLNKGYLPKSGWIGKYNRLGEPLAKIVHADLQPFMIIIRIDITPDHESYPSDDESIMEFITYDQALAYYYWKTKIKWVDEEFDWQDYVLPSLEEFEIIQKKGKIVKNQKMLVYPASTFKYVVHLYPSKAE
ncbi:MAG: hypothetical protein HRT57_13750 [Crocinitomicaceae bacterium]|nr:hypothetical protein [Crocinitomicaceae bacterium]